MLVYECAYCWSKNPIKLLRCSGCGAPASIEPCLESTQDGQLITVKDSVPHDIASSIIAAEGLEFYNTEEQFGRLA